MSLEGLLALVGIIIAVYALAQPVQRRSIRLLVPIWLVISSIVISAGLLIWRYAVPTFCYEFLSWSDFATMMGAFAIPIIGALLGYWSWNKAKLTRRKDERFRKFVQTCIKENKFDELLRILEKNEKSLVKILEKETLDILFEKCFIKTTISSQNWVHLRLLSDNALIDNLTDRLASINNLMRALLDAETSPLHSAIVSKYGGREYTHPTDDEWNLIEKTLQNPEWYMKLRVDYPLIISAYETIASGKLDEQYNKKDDLYSASQGESTRLRCPIFLALKTHILMLMKAIEIEDEKDYYVSDIWDLFRNVCEHSTYDPLIWEDENANREYPTPFAYLIKEIFFDLKELCREGFKQGRRIPGFIGSNIIGTWATCVSFLGQSKENVSDKFKFECLNYYFVFMLDRKLEHEQADGERQDLIKSWLDNLVKGLKHFVSGNKRLKRVLSQSVDEIDRVKYANHIDWLRRELDLPERP